MWKYFMHISNNYKIVSLEKFIKTLKNALEGIAVYDLYRQCVLNSFKVTYIKGSLVFWDTIINKSCPQGI